jgi:hypothetical protein
LSKEKIDTVAYHFIIFPLSSIDLSFLEIVNAKTLSFLSHHLPEVSSILMVYLNYS